MRIAVLIGTRPEAIKMAPVVSALRRQPGNEVFLCASGQHGEMLDIVLADFGLKPDARLPAPPTAPDLSLLTSHLLQGISPWLEGLAPDWLLIQGDTTTVMASALAASHRKIKIGHVEAGLRSFNKHSPWPEEMNRKLTTALADVHFAPTETARQNLVNEGVPPGLIHVTGNTVVDALQHIRERITERPETLPEPVRAEKAQGRRLVLVTCHRRENFGEPLKRICGAVAELAVKYRDCSFVWPVHKNPNVENVVTGFFQGVPNVILLPPLSYESLLGVLMRSSLALSDSGGLQEEAPSFQVPVLVLRDTTERPEGLAAGAARLVGANEALIVQAASAILDQSGPWTPINNPYGDGHASTRIAHILSEC